METNLQVECLFIVGQDPSTIWKFKEVQKVASSSIKMILPKSKCVVQMAMIYKARGRKASNFNECLT